MSAIYLSFSHQMRALGPDMSMAFLIRSYRHMFLVFVLLAIISCGGLQTVEEEYDFAFFIENADISLPAFVMKNTIKTTISDSEGGASGLRVRIFSYEEYENTPGILPGAHKSLINVYLIRRMDGSGAVRGTMLTIERWTRIGRDKRVDTWKFSDMDMDGIPDKVVFTLITETKNNTFLDMHAVKLEEGEAVSGYYRRLVLEIRERGLSDVF